MPHSVCIYLHNVFTANYLTSRHISGQLRQVYLCVRSEVLTVVQMSLLVFWVITPCGLVGKSRHFEKNMLAPFKAV
jgi:hypothetical protein